MDISVITQLIGSLGFPPEVHERPLKEEGAALFNVYETVNRNRELQGRKPLQMLLLSNANRLDSPVLAELDRMNKKGQEEWINPQICVFTPFIIWRSRK